MLIIIDTIPHKDQRYPTVGDWMVAPGSDSVIINISQLGSWRYEVCVAIHELIEMLCCVNKGISTRQVDRFDKEYEDKRKEGDKSEPGDHPDAPYHREHFFATTIERLLAAELGVDWLKYEEAIDSL